MATGTARHDYLYVPIPYGAEERRIELDGRGGGDLLSVEYRVPDSDPQAIYRSATLFGGSGNDLIDAENVEGVAYGGAGDDAIRWREARGELYGGFGDDYFYVTGADDAIFLYGGTGNDNAFVEQPGGSAFIDFGAGDDLLRLVTDYARVYGGSGDDRLEISGQTEGATIDGGAGADDIRVEGTGHSTISAGSGNDRIFTQTATGSIDAGSGLDHIRIIRGEHIVTLGGVPDRLEFMLGHAEVTDFRIGNSGDQLSLRYVFDADYPRDVAKEDLVSAGYIRVRQDGADTIVEGDQDAGGDLYGWTEFVRLNNVRIEQLTPHNLDGLLL
jgi:Ca2+-binding RTX toxin-like protein